MAKQSSIIQESQTTLASLDQNNEPLDERINSPSALRSIHESFKHNDEESSANRTAVQELVDFVPPYDPKELSDRGQSDRFNVNFGMVSAIKNEAVGSYHDIFTTPVALLELALDNKVEAEEKEQWASVMSEEFTTMLRSWDASTPQMLLLDDLIVTHGIAIPWFEDGNNLQFEVGGMEDFNFDDDQVAISSKVEACTVERVMSTAKIWSKIADKPVDKDGYTSDGWNRDMVIELINRAQPNDGHQDAWSYEKVQREIKGNRITGGKHLPSIELVWGFIREMDGTYSVYAAAYNNRTSASDSKLQFGSEQEEKYVFVQRHRYKDANQAFQIFSFGIGNKNNIHTIRGLAYFLYEAGQADNVIKCKGLEAARMRASEIYQPQGGVDSEQDMQMIDVGHAMIIPQSLKGVQQPGGQPLDKTIGVAQGITREVMDRHSGGLASAGVLENPAARRNELQVSAELDHLSKLLSFAINLYYPPFEKLLRELARRAFTETQTDLETMELVKDMKRRILERGVPKDMFSKIDLKRSKAQRIMGAGSRGTRMLIFSQMSQLFPEMDPVGQEKFTFDWATEMVGHDRTIRYFGRPDERRGHTDIAIARLENGRLSEGDYVEPTPGENSMVHLQIHIEEGLEPGLAAVEEGGMDFEDYVLDNVTLFEHTVKTLEATTVHESIIGKLNALRQRTQQIGEIIENGLKEINAKRRREGEQSLQRGEGGGQPGAEGGQPGAEGGQPGAEGGQPGAEGGPSDSQVKAAEAQQKMEQTQREGNVKLETMIAATQAKLESMAKMTEAKISLDKTASMAKIALLDGETSAKIRRAEIIERAKGSTR